MTHDIWNAGIDGLRRECKSEHLVGSVLQEVSRRDPLDDFFPGCRLFRIDSELLQGRDRCAIQRFYVLRPDDERAYQLHRDPDVVALARAEHVRLESPRSALAFAGFALGLELDEDESPERTESAWVVTGSAEVKSDGAREPASVILRLDEDSHLLDVVRVGRVDAPECGPSTETNLEETA